MPNLPTGIACSLKLSAVIALKKIIVPVKHLVKTVTMRKRESTGTGVIALHQKIFSYTGTFRWLI